MAEKEPEKKTNRLRNELKPSAKKDADKKDADSADESGVKDSPEKEKKAREKKPQKERPKTGSVNPVRALYTRITSNEKLRRISGFFFLLIAAPYLAVAFTSYLFTWQADQDKVMGPFSELMFGKEDVSNILGKFGALISHIFIHGWFGVTSFFFPFIFFLAGLRLLAGIK
ncbi:MAG TPA: DNA translocase FtsK 4TM domain-containing protein, partial [Bacteroidia bacterium]|nr:DNA translocase FtsK 4TM domain-containing protein [Bacteroidia bacterium]